MPLRVVQWSTGTVGGIALRSLIERPEFALAGVYVHDPGKVGRDAGELAGRAPTGVIATSSVDDIVDLRADCVCHMPLPSFCFGADPHRDTADICRLLAAGTNVVTTTGFVQPRERWIRDRIDAACAAGGASLYGTGVNPGFIADALPIALSGMAQRVDHIYLRETSDFSGHPSRRMVVDLMGFTKQPEDYLAGAGRYRAYQRIIFGESMRLVASALGTEIDDIEESDEYAVAPESYDAAIGEIPAGTVHASRWTISGLLRGMPVMTVELVHKADAARCDLWSDPGFALRVEGVPSISVSVDEFSHGLVGAAAHAVNAIPAVCAAPPGLLTCLDLPLIAGRRTATFR
ncbi:MAG TPA: dihydrodipicolinate reductase [Streptosporangiaceae bacterium]